METKTFEIRDRGTFMPFLAVRLLPSCEADRYLFARAGYTLQPVTQGEYVILINIEGNGVNAQYDPYGWPGGARTVPAAHQYIIDHWSELESGAVIDVEFILGETKEQKISEAHDGSHF